MSHQKQNTNIRVFDCFDSLTASVAKTVTPKVMVAATLERAAAKGNVTLVETIEALFLDEVPKTLDIASFANMLERLVLDPFSYRPTAVRLLLNLALSEDGVYNRCG